MGLSEVHQVLTMNGLRDKVVLHTDGGLKTGRDIVMAAMLGADEWYRHFCAGGDGCIIASMPFQHLSRRGVYPT